MRLFRFLRIYFDVFLSTLFLFRYFLERLDFDLLLGAKISSAASSTTLL